MAQSVPIDIRAGISKTGVAFGATIYQLDGTTSFAAFSTSGWYEEPAASGSYHHPGVSFPDAGGVVKYGVSGTVYNTFSVGPAAVTVGAINANVVNASALAADAVAEIQSGLATATNVTSAQSAIQADIAAVQADTDDLQARIGSNGAGLTALASATNLATANTNISAINTKLGTPAGASVSADIAALLVQILAILDDTGTTGVVLSAATKQAIADEMLKRGMVNVDDSSPEELSLYHLIAAILNGSTSSGVWTAHKSTGGTFTTSTLTTDNAALPVTGVST